MFSKLRFLGFLFSTMPERNAVFLSAKQPFTLQTISDNPGSKRVPKRLGRGNGNGKGNSCGRGQRGQLSRSGGGVPPKFEGGQSPLTRRLPKWGAKPNQEIFKEVNLCQIIDRVIQGRLDISKTITIRDLKESGIFKKAIYGVKVLARGAERLNELQAPLKLEVSDISKPAIEAIKANGGDVVCVYRTPLLLREHFHPEKFPLQLRDPVPAARVVKMMRRIEDKGVKVEYVKPKWVQEDESAEKVEIVKIISEQQTVKKEKKSKKNKNNQVVESEEIDLSNFKFPVSRAPGVGIDKIRKRKPEIYRQVKINVE